MSYLEKVQFDTKISKGSGGGYKIPIPKRIFDRFPHDLWVIQTVYIRSEGFKQTLKNHPCSKSGDTKRYVPIYTSDIEADYENMGTVNVELIYEV